MTDLTLRIPKGSPITYEEMDSNLLALDSDTPFKVSDGHITYEGNIGIGVDSTYRPTYNLDFGSGDSNNEATIGTTNADLHVHVNGSNDLKVSTNTQERLTLTPTGNLGINQTSPEFPLDIDGNARITGTFRGNQFRAYSFSDSADLTISNGNITNVKRFVSTEQIDFTQLYDRSTGYKVDHIDSIIVDDSNGFPTTKAVYDALDGIPSYEAGDGISLVGTEFSVAGNTNLTADSNGLSLNSALTGMTSYGTGNWSIEVNSDNLIFKYGADTVLRIEPSGKVISKNDVKGFGSP